MILWRYAGIDWIGEAAPGRYNLSSSYRTSTQTSCSAGEVGVAQFYLPAADEECAEVDDQ